MEATAEETPEETVVPLLRKRMRRGKRFTHKKRRLVPLKRNVNRGVKSLIPTLPPDDLALSAEDRICLAIEHNYSLNDELVTNKSKEPQDLPFMEDEDCSGHADGLENVFIKEEILDDEIDIPNSQDCSSLSNEEDTPGGTEKDFSMDTDSGLVIDQVFGMCNPSELANYDEEVVVSNGLDPGTTNTRSSKKNKKSLKNSLQSPDPHSLELKLLINVDGQIRHSLPAQWMSVIADGGIHLLMMSKGELKVSQRDLFVRPDGEVKLSVHGQYVPKMHQVWTRLVARYKLIPSSIVQFSKQICMLVHLVNKFEVCPGVTIDMYQSLWKTVHGAVLDENLFHETHYTTTVRSRQCIKLVPKVCLVRCSACESIYGKLKKKFAKSQCPNPLEFSNSQENPQEDDLAICFSFLPQS